MIIPLTAAAILITLVILFVIKSNKKDLPSNGSSGGSSGGDVDIDDQSPDKIY